MNRRNRAKRSPSATFDEWLWAAEYVLAEGNDKVVLCERGIRAFEKSDTLDIAAVPTVKESSHLPVLVFPSHAVTDDEIREAFSKAVQKRMMADVDYGFFLSGGGLVKSAEPQTVLRDSKLLARSSRSKSSRSWS